MKFIVTDIKKAASTEDNEEIGTPKARYAGPEFGPFHCGHCVHFKEMAAKEGRCNHPKVIADPEIPKKDGVAKVDEGGCCSYFNPGGY